MRKSLIYGNLHIAIIAFILAIFGLFVLYKWSNKKSNIEEGFEVNDMQLVISRYNEDLKWLIEEPFLNYVNIIYNKGDNNNFVQTDKTLRVEKLENVGKCDHTYLYHIINNYDNLAKVTIFLPGSLNMDFKKERALELIQNLEANDKNTWIGERVNDVKNDLYDFQMDEWKTSDKANVNANQETKLLPAIIRPFGAWYEQHFGDTDVKYISYWGIFSVDKKTIHTKPVEYYKNLITELETHSNPEVGHYFERSWGAIFKPEKEDDFIYIER